MAEIVPVRRKFVSEEVSDGIKNMIVQGHWPPGTRIPPEKVLAKMFGVSRPSLREALKKLSLMGLIEVRHGEGSFVSSLAPESFMKPLIPMLMCHRDDIIKIMEARKLIEVEVAALAAIRAGHDDVERLRRNLERMQALVGNCELFAEEDYNFHCSIVLALGNKIISKIYEAVGDLLLSQQKVIIKLPGAYDRGIRDHASILHAIEMRDSKLARKAMEDHVRNTERAILDNYLGSRE